jgi:sugar O-acyltransferase (sialic acid O-acetyltransferase NeuD family)
MISVIFGTGGQGREVADLLLRDGDESNELLFCETEPRETFVMGIRVIPISKLLEIKTKIGGIHVAIGNPQNRSTFFKEFESQNFDLRSVVSTKCSLSSFSEVGRGCIISDFSFIGPETIIGCSALINYGATVSHDAELGNYVTLGPGARVNGHVQVGDYVTIGSNSVIRNGTKSRPLRIGSGVTIGAGSVVLTDIPDGTTVVGNPARPISS